MAKTEYVLYKDTDASDVVKLMKRNKFYLAKFDKNLTTERFIKLQKKRGLLFAVIAKNKDTVIAHVAAYQNGGQKVSTANQVYVSSMIVDMKYRLSMYTIMELYSKLIEEIVSHDFTDIISEVAYNNTASLYLLRKCGYVLFDDKHDIYGNYLLHNYLPAIIKMSGTGKALQSSILTKYLSPFNKKYSLATENIIDDHYIFYSCDSPYGKLKLYININSGIIAGVEVSNKFIFQPIAGELRKYICGNKSDRSVCINITYFKKEKEWMNKTLQLEKDESVEVNVSDEVDKIEININEFNIDYFFFPKEVVKYDDTEESRIMCRNNIYLSEKTGFLSFGELRKPLFMEMWPHMVIPYVEGILVPNRNKNLSFSTAFTNSYSLSQLTEHYKINRDYLFNSPKEVIINTNVQIDECVNLEPIFQIGLYDIGFKCEIELIDGDIIQKQFDFNCTYSCTEELLYVNFEKEPYSEIPFKCIKLQYGDKEYVISTEKEARCFCHFNYIGIIYNEMIYAGKHLINFGEIRIYET